MNQIRLGTEVRAKSNHAVTGVLSEYYEATEPRYHVKTAWGSAWINDDEIEVVPPEPFDTDTLVTGDLVERGSRSFTTSLIIVNCPSNWIGMELLRVWKRRGNDYVMVYDADQGDYLESEGAK